MKFEEIAENVVGDVINSKGWNFAIKHLRINISSIDLDHLNFIGGYNCNFSRKTISGKEDIPSVPGYFFGTTIGFLVICPSDNNFPAVDFIHNRDIRVVETESKLFGAQIRMSTNNHHYTFKVDKKKFKDIDRFVAEIRATI